ncbi:MAG: class I SAM-dependent methyltransferase [Proteobacteria bacterium]|nr:class I SAM-dependent methyltransferase [Cystobacterineae bacterium]MCL2258502.1 class I SAM-dependent methyltransferase [Cystobacterineae bacterium]MCL2315158.1 class I SAM-dependent methyltransferase [Pseudomonadota bacterium]
MFENYPKTRQELPPDFQRIYNEHYKNNREGESTGSSLAQKMESWMHKKVAKDVKRTKKSTLEIGAGTLNQLKYEKTNPYDIVEPFTKLYVNSPYKAHVRNIYKDIDEIDISTKYDRIISIATFEHILDLPKVVAKSVLLLNKEGVLRVAIPNEGTLLWKLGWKLTTGLEFKLKYGLDYGILMKHEHVNTADEIENILYHFFKKHHCSCFGTGKILAFYRFYECFEPNVELAEKYLA